MSDTVAGENRIRVLRLTHESAGLLSKLAPEVFDYEVNHKYLNAFLNDERHFMVLAVDEKLVVGMASAVEYFHPDKPPQLWINEVSVTKAYRRRGIARNMVNALLQEARSRACIFAWLGTATDNESGNACFGSIAGVGQVQPFFLYEWDLKS